MPDKETTNRIIGQLITREKYRFADKSLIADVVCEAMIELLKIQKELLNV